MTEGGFFQDLAVMMAVVGFVTVLFTRLKWPKVIGYLVAGIIMGRYTFGGGLLTDETSIETIGQIGVVFLMFTMGLEFSPSAMRRVRHVTIPTALFDSAVMIWLGYTVGRSVFGWSSVQSLFLGAAICDSATTLLAKTIDELGWSSRPFVRYIFGTTIVEDILCVGVIALITGVAHGGGVSLVEAGRSLGSLAVFTVAVLALGIALVPRTLNRVARSNDDETLLLALLGTCFFVSYLAMKLKYSLALGAFMVGVFGACSDVRQRLHRLAGPLRSMFAAVFFVSIGLLVDPAACWRHAGAIIALSAAIIAGKFFNCAFMSIVAGQGVKSAVETGFGLAQIGEFAYMVALLYVTETGDASNGMYQIVVGASLVTTCLNPLLLRLSDPVGDWAEQHLPARFSGALAAYRSWLERFRSALAPTRLRADIRNRVAILAVIMILQLAITLCAGWVNGRDLSALGAFVDAHKRVIVLLAADLAFAAMLVLFMGTAKRLGEDVAEVVAGPAGGGRWRTEARRFISFAVGAALFMLGFAQVAAFNWNLAPTGLWPRIALFGAILAIAAALWKRLRAAGVSAARHFRAAVEAEKRHSERASGEVLLAIPGDFYACVNIKANSRAVGETIRSLDVRARTGASITSVDRGGVRSRNPGPSWTFAPGDEVMVIGEPAQIRAFRELVA